MTELKDVCIILSTQLQTIMLEDVIRYTSFSIVLLVSLISCCKPVAWMNMNMNIHVVYTVTNMISKMRT